jgi:histone H3/H4
MSAEDTESVASSRSRAPTQFVFNSCVLHRMHLAVQPQALSDMLISNDALELLSGIAQQRLAVLCRASAKHLATRRKRVEPNHVVLAAADLGLPTPREPTHFDTMKVPVYRAKKDTAGVGERAFYRGWANAPFFSRQSFRGAVREALRPCDAVPGGSVIFPMQACIEDQIKDLLTMAHRLARHRGKRTVKPCDVALADEIMPLFTTITPAPTPPDSDDEAEAGAAGS